MATIRSIANKKACSGVNGANTGKLGCLSLFGSPAHLIPLSRGTKLLGTESFNIALIKNLVQTGKAIPLMDASTFEDMSAEDAYTTNSSGEKRLNLKGLPEYKLTFEEGHEFYREIAKLETYKSYDFIIGDDEGNWMMVVDNNGNYQGFSAGHVTPELTKRKVKGGESESKSILVQFLDRSQFDRNYVILHADQLDFSPSDIPTVNGANLKLDTIPSSTDTTLVVDVTLSTDRTSTIEGLDDEALWSVKKGGADVTISGVTEGTPGKYTLTIPALAAQDELEIDLYDSVANSHIIDSSDILYRAESLKVTVLA